MIKQHNKKQWILTLLLGCFILSGSLFAQPQHRQGPPPLPDSTKIVKMVDELAKKLSLKEEQKTEIEKLHHEHFAEAEQLMAGHKSEREKHRQKMDALRQDFEEQVKALLNAKQKTEFEQFVKKHKPESRQKRPRRR